jgi:two-component system OmpR family sensor kinase
LVIVLKSYEKHSFFRFFFIYISVLLLLFIALSSLYYFKERQRYFQEQKVTNKIEFSECTHLKRLLKDAPECMMRPIDITQKIKLIYREIFYAFLLSLLLILPFGYFLARLSLKPMQEAMVAMDSFINGIVHDINTPLSVIQMNAQSINKSIKDKKLEVKSLRLLQGVQQIKELEEQLLFSIKVGQYVLQKSLFDLGEVLHERVVYYNNIRQSISINVENIKYIVYADRTALLRMIDNIVINAIKYSNAKKEVLISLEENTLYIKDQGIGIKNPKKVFDKYYREAKNNTGIGLGLFIVAKVAQLHNINITIESQLQEGTKFSLNLKEISSRK